MRERLRTADYPRPIQRAMRLVFVTAALSMVAPGCAREGRDSAVDEGAQIIAGRVAPATRGLRSVVILEPQPPRASTVTTDTAVMDQFGITFIPALLVVQVGQEVEFRNSEDVAHNVRVVDHATGSTLFNVATLMGDPYRYRFERSGSYAVQCDIHPAMSAVVLVVSTPYTVVVEDSGEFSLEGVPPGSYRLTVWSADSSRRIERVVDIGAGRTTLSLP